ncbi:BTAD domain-containing putative transcriptional regulator [Dactylosporangium sp. NPDC049742]|uniref:BTAD domain-containing putative transcriptional regulator n=1 Tax=Dactylosporangium sp. NPDC049742 TaxID=3154737 RepID=UPI00343E0A06
MNLRIDLFGGFRVYVEGRAIDPGMWTQRKPAALVKMLALAPGQRLRREQVTAALWPEFEPSAAAANLRKVLHSARRILHSVDGAEYIVSAGDLLFLPPGRLSVDVGDYWSLVAEARASRKVDAYAAAIAVYRQGLLPEDLYEEWAAAPREELNADFLALVGEYAGLLEAGGDLVEAARAVQRLVAADQLGEANHAWLMRLYALAGRRDEAQRQYARLCEVLQEELGVRPAAETQRLYEEIRAEQVSEPALTTDLWERVGDLRVQSGNPSAAVQAYAQALAAAPSGRVHRKAAGAWLMQHRPDEAEPHLAAADGFGPGPAERGRLSCLRAQLAWERGDLAAAGRHAEEAHTAALAHGDEDDVAAALEALAFVSHLRGDWRPGLQHQIERLTGSALGQRVARFCDFNHCLSQYQLYGDDSTRDVDEYARETLALAERLDAVPAQAFAWCLLGESLLLRARWDEAAACLERSCDLYEPLGSRTVALPWLRAPSWRRVSGSTPRRPCSSSGRRRSRL